MEASSDKIVDVDSGILIENAADSSSSGLAPEANLEASFEATAMQDENELGQSQNPEVAPLNREQAISLLIRGELALGTPQQQTLALRAHFLI